MKALTVMLVGLSAITFAMPLNNEKRVAVANAEPEEECFVCNGLKEREPEPVPEPEEDCFTCNGL